jgi:universal stress protein E
VKKRAARSGAAAQRGRIRRILVAVKTDRARAWPAVVKAAQLARLLGAELVLFQALTVPLPGGAEPASRRGRESEVARAMRDSCLQTLEGLAVRLRRRGIEVRVCVDWDSPAYDAITRAAHRLHAGLIVAEQHAGWHHPAHLLHPTDWELLRRSRMPVLLVARRGPYRRPVVLAALDPDHSFAKPARLDAQILNAASELASGLRGALHAVHAYVPLPVAALARGTTEETVARLKRQAAAAAREKLAASAAGVPRSRRHIVARHPADAIVEVAAKTRSSIVVMGAVSRSGLKRLLIGSTAERVLGRLPCDLLIIRPRGEIRSTSRIARALRAATVQLSGVII